MKKIVRITESEINNIVKRVLNEDKHNNISEGIFDNIKKGIKDTFTVKKIEDYTDEELEQELENPNGSKAKASGFYLEDIRKELYDRNFDELTKEIVGHIVRLRKLPESEVEKIKKTKRWEFEDGGGRGVRNSGALAIKKLGHLNYNRKAIWMYGDMIYDFSMDEPMSYYKENKESTIADIENYMKKNKEKFWKLGVTYDNIN